MSADNLSHVGRNFYEWSLMKTVLGILYFGLAVFYLGMVARAGGLSQAYLQLKKDAEDGSAAEDSYNCLTVGYGFAGFFYFCSFVVAIGAAFHILPCTGGSAKEAKAVSNPASLESNA